MPVHSKQKGKRGELEVAKILRDAGLNAERGQQNRGGPQSPDVIVHEWPDINIEVKRREQLDLFGAMRQSWRDAGEDKLAVVVHRRTRETWMTTMDFGDFIELYKENLYLLERVKVWKDRATEAELKLGEMG